MVHGLSGAMIPLFLLKQDNLNVIMTEKDYYKCNDFQINEIKCLKISLEIENKEQLLNKVKEIYV